MVIPLVLSSTSLPSHRKLPFVKLSPLYSLNYYAPCIVQRAVRVRTCLVFTKLFKVGTISHGRHHRHGHCLCFVGMGALKVKESK